MLPFEKEEYLARVERVKASMSERGLDLLLATDPANMNYLTGYDGWSFYTPQAVVIGLELEEPICIVRGIDRNGGLVTTFLREENVVGYPDNYVHSTERHPMDYIAGELTRRGLDRGAIGVEMDAHYYTAAAHGSLVRGLPNAKFADATSLINWVRSIKSEQEILYITQAALILERTMQTALEVIEPGVRQCDAVAAIYHAQIKGTEAYGGEYTAIVPMLPTGIGTSTPHLTWSDQVFVSGEATILELAAARHRYHCPQARTLFLGTPPLKLSESAKIVVEGLEAALAVAKPGAACEEVERAWAETIAKSGLVKDSRIGYSVGLNYPPDWGEHTISLRPGDRTILQPNMTLHLIPGIWQADWGIEISECFRVTESGAKPFCATPRKLFVKD